jgi:hypothetical protein
MRLIFAASNDIPQKEVYPTCFKILSTCVGKLAPTLYKVTKGSSSNILHTCYTYTKDLHAELLHHQL